MFQPLRDLRAAVLAIPLLVVAASLHAQNRQNQEDRPRIERLVFEGVEAVDEAELRRSMVTEETRCRSILMRPFCWVTDWDVFIDKNFLDRQELPRDQLRLRVFYFRRGYREAEVATQVRPRGRGVEVVFTIAEGPPTLIDAVDVRQAEELLRERHFRRAGLPREGDPLDLSRLDTALINLQEMLEERGYLDAVIRDSVELARAERRARVEITVDPGRRATLEEFDIRGNEQVADRTIQDATILRRGRVIRRSDILAARRSLYESNLFHEAEVTVPEQPDSAKRVEIRVREAPPRAATVGAGFNTLDFVQTEGRFIHYNALNRGGRLDLRVTVGNLFASQLNDSGIFSDVLPRTLAFEDEDAFLRPTWQASADFTQPAFRAAENSVGLGIFADRRIIPGIAIDRGYGANASFTRLTRDRSPASLSYRFEVTSVEAGDLYFCVNHGICDPRTISVLRGEQRLAPLGASFTSDRTDDPLSPTRGLRTRLDLEHASELTLSEYRYHRISGAAAYHIPLGWGRRVLAGRLRAGWIRPLAAAVQNATADPLEGEALLHPRKRFYAGGSRSVRGYGENQLGPRILTVDPQALLDPENGGCTPEQVGDGTCDPNLAPIDAFWPRPLGGRSVLEANLEYRFPLWRELGAVVFVDGGIVAGRGEGFLSGARAITPGFGVRYQSPVGPIRADLGIRPTLVEFLPVVTEIVDEEGEPQIVRLQIPRRFDPLEGTDGFLAQVLNRVVLHLSIGQAF
jgi:outer membrane protein insertion porin family